MDKEENLLVNSQQEEKNFLDQNDFKGLTKQPDEIEYNASQLNKNSERTNSEDESIHSKIKSLNSLPLKKQRELIASIHSFTETIGDFKADNLKSCPCCNQKIPRPYRYKKTFYSDDLFEYGIDLINFNSILKMIYRYIKFFWISLLFFSLISIFVDFSLYIKNLKIYFNEISASSAFFILDTIFLVNLDIIFKFLIYASFVAILIFLFLKIQDKISLNMKKYRMNILDNKEIEETLFSVFVKGLPKLTEKDDLKQFLEDEYKVVIREIILLNDYSVLESYREKLNYFYETSDVTKNQLEKIFNQINHYANNVERNSCAIVIFDQVEDRLLFFREFFNLKEVLYMLFKKNFIYRGKRIYFEPVPSLKMIDWANCKYSFEKTLSSTKLKYVISFSLTAGLYTFVYYTIFFVTTLKLLENEILNSFVTNIILMALNFLFKFSLTLLVASFKLSDNYLKEILKSYFIAYRNVNNTVFVNLILFASGEKSNYSILFLIILQNLKLGFLSIYNYDYIYRKLSYSAYFKKKLNSQETLNEVLGFNTFNFMSTFESFKISFYLMIFSLMKSLTLGLFGLVFLIIHYYMIKYAFVNSRIRDFNKNYYGFYFSHTLSKELILTGKFFLVYIVALGLKSKNSSIILIVNLASDFVLDIFNSKSYYNKFYVKEKYNNIKFTRKFEDEKYVNISKYMQSIQTLKEKITKNFQ